jgi:beta-alanine--pyruvate transaminase
MSRQAERLPYYSLFGYTTEPAVHLADRLARLLPAGLEHIFFTNSGSEAVDTALKIARAYWQRRGQGKRCVLIGRHLAFHGVNFGGLSVAGIPRNRVPFGPLLPEVAHLPHNHCLHCPFGLTYPSCNIACGQALEEAIATAGPEAVAAVIIEPVLGAGGVIPPPDGYLQLVADICRRHDVLLIFDEVITGFGRTGAWFAAQRYDVTPDLLVMAKGLSSAYAPIGAVAASERVHEAFVDLGGDLELPHGYTYSGHPVSCAAALANLDILEEEDLPGRVAAMEQMFLSAIGSLSDLPQVSEVRGVGFLGGIELDSGAEGAAAASKKAWEAGVIVRTLFNTLALSPPLIVTESEIEKAVAVLRDAIR